MNSYPLPSSTIILSSNNKHNHYMKGLESTQVSNELSKNKSLMKPKIPVYLQMSHQHQITCFIPLVMQRHVVDVAEHGTCTQTICVVTHIDILAEPIHLFHTGVISLGDLSLKQDIDNCNSYTKNSFITDITFI